jgi:hypothetical protein
MCIYVQELIETLVATLIAIVAYLVMITSTRT